jgi:catechol 2,3-dioxygenase-like lactoylglutathione lyase family enzyme|tara:strand:+ start:107 stop:454 length:348 start_codon:yes stop_codon:yes gene_type:complete
MSSKSKIDHIAILVGDLKVAEEWYMKRVKGSVTFRDNKYTRMQIGNTNIVLIDKKHYPRGHIGILVDDLEDLPLEKGNMARHRDGTIGVYEEDPFGNYLEYIWYPDKRKKVFLDD